jgi:cell division protein FtsI/penicillin-binding protein 2
MNKLANSVDPQKLEVIKKRHFAFRINVFFFCTFLVFSILIVRLAILQFVQGTELSKMEEQRTVTHNSIPPIRGNIYDRSGHAIAYSDSTQSLFYHYDSGRKKEELVRMAKSLSDIFALYGAPGKRLLSPNDIIKAMDVGFDIELNKTAAPSLSFVPRRIKADLSKEEIAYILEHRDLFQGIEIVEESIRKYDKRGIAVQLIGYLRPYSVAKEERHGLEYYKGIERASDPQYNYLLTEDVGFDGIEFMYQEELRGKNGMKSYPVNASQQIIGQVTITPPVKGNNVHLTIHEDVQLTAEQAILDQLVYMKSEEAKRLKWPYAPFARAGYAVAMEVKTGKVVAMASMPDYDSNVWAGGSISTENWVKIQPYYQNGTIREVYPDYTDDKERAKHPSSLVPLGSTIKPLTILLGLNEKLITAGEKFNDTGTFYFGRDNSVSVSNSDKKAFGPIDAAKAIEKSSNTYMSAMIGNRLFAKYSRDGSFGVNGVLLWDEYMKKFGLGITTGSGLPKEIAGTREYENEIKTGSAQSALIYSSFGQQGRYTPLQLAQYTATLANRGKRPKPMFVEKTTTVDGELVKTFEPQFLNEETFPDAYWDVIEKGMLAVSKRGFDNFPYLVASKTGTSQQQVAGGAIVNNAVFIAYAPAEDPQLAVAVVVPEGGYGAWGAAPIARKIFDAYDKHIGLMGKPNPNAGAVEPPRNVETTETPSPAAPDGTPEDNTAGQDGH